MKKMARRKLIEKQYPSNILCTIEKMGRSRYIMPTKLTSDISNGIEYAISQLARREQDIVFKRYIERKSFDEIGDIYGLTGNRISQIDRKIMRKLSSPPLVGYLVYGMTGFKNRLKVCQSTDVSRMPEKVFNIPIPELEIPVNIKRFLFRKGYKTIKDVIQDNSFETIDENIYKEVWESILMLMALYVSG